MSKYLDETGLGVLWTKIKNTFDTKTSNIAASRITGKLAASNLPSYVDDILEFGGVVTGETKTTLGTGASVTANTDPATVRYFKDATLGGGDAIADGFYQVNDSTNVIDALPESGNSNGVVPSSKAPEKGKIYVSVKSNDNKVYRYGGAESGLVEIYNPSQLSNLESLVYRLHFNYTLSGGNTVEVGKSSSVTIRWSLTLDGTAVDAKSVQNFVLTKVDKTGSSDVTTTPTVNYATGSYTDTITPTKAGTNATYTVSFVYQGKAYTKTVSLVAYRRTYWGTSDAIDGGTYTNLALGGGSILSSPSAVYDVTTSTNKFVYIISPLSTCGGSVSTVKNISVTAGGQPIPFETKGYVEAATSSLGEIYVIYKSVNEQPSRSYLVYVSSTTSAATKLA